MAISGGFIEDAALGAKTTIQSFPAEPTRAGSGAQVPD